MAKKLTQEEFEKSIFRIHGDSINLSNAVYVKDSIKVKCKCNICGNIWETTPNNLKHGRGCPLCNHKSRKYTLDEWLELAKKVHHDKYDLSLVTNYEGRTQKLNILCREKFKDGQEHGVFQIRSDHFLEGCGCPKCALEASKKKQIKPYNEMVLNAKKIHGDKYEYDEKTYVNANTKMKIVCPKHGEFWQTPHKHIDMKHGCPKCNQSKLETEIEIFLTKNKLKFNQSKHFDFLGLQHLDFYLPKYNIAIECQGEQHYEEVRHFGGKENFETTKERDQRKKLLCNENGVKLLYFTHYDGIEADNIETFKDKEKLLEEILKQ